MANKVEFKDFSFAVKTAINDASIAWLYTWADEITSHAKDNCKLDGDAGNQLRKSYRNVVDEKIGEAQIGSNLEQAFWEEYGTGEYADTNKNGGREGRRGYWIYTPGSEGPAGYQSRVYATKDEADEMAQYIRRKYKKTAIVTSGRRPSYTLENAFTKNKAKAIADAEQKLKGGLK